jgi:hypothetical protein
MTGDEEFMLAHYKKAKALADWLVYRWELSLEEFPASDPRYGIREWHPSPQLRAYCTSKLNQCRDSYSCEAARFFSSGVHPHSLVLLHRASHLVCARYGIVR